MNLYKELEIKKVYKSYVQLKLRKLSYKGYFESKKYKYKLYYLDIFSLIKRYKIRDNYKYFFAYLENRIKNLLIYFKDIKLEILITFKLLKNNIKYKDYKIKRLYFNKDTIFNN